MNVVAGVATVERVEDFVAALDEVGAEYGVTVQAFDARYIVSRAHLERAVELADRAFERGENVARDRGVEILLYAAGRRQIDQALMLGVSTGTQSVVVLVDATDADDEGDDAEAEAGAVTAVEALLDSTGELRDYDDERVREYFDVGDRELRVVDGDLADVVLERVALLDVEK
jgi:KEOPS complex subunit Cgi121